VLDGGVQIPHCKGKFLEESCADPLSTEKYREVRCGMMNEGCASLRISVRCWRRCGLSLPLP